MDINAARNQIMVIGKLLYKREYISGFDGNLSVKTGPKRILITPTMIPKGFLKRTDLITIDVNGKKLAGRKEPSSEAEMHLQVYRNRAEIKACCHAHPPYATAFAASKQPLKSGLLPESTLLLGDIKNIEYIPTGLPDKWRKFARYAASGYAYLLKNHGVLTIGRTLEEAYFRMETVEHYAHIVYIAQKIGRLDFLDKKEIVRLNEIRKKYFNET